MASGSLRTRRLRTRIAGRKRSDKRFGESVVRAYRDREERREIANETRRSRPKLETSNRLYFLHNNNNILHVGGIKIVV